MSKKHILIMLACWLVPALALGAIFIFKLPVSQVIYFGFILLCPLSHILMMSFMGHDEGDEQHHHSALRVPREKIEVSQDG